MRALRTRRTTRGRMRAIRTRRTTHKQMQRMMRARIRAATTLRSKVAVRKSRSSLDPDEVRNELTGRLSGARPVPCGFLISRARVHRAFTSRIIGLIARQIPLATRKCSHAKGTYHSNHQCVLCKCKFGDRTDYAASCKSACRDKDDPKDEDHGEAAERRVDRVFETGRCKGTAWQGTADLPIEMHERSEEENLKLRPSDELTKCGSARRRRWLLTDFERGVPAVR